MRIQSTKFVAIFNPGQYFGIFCSFFKNEILRSIDFGFKKSLKFMRTKLKSGLYLFEQWEKKSLGRFIKSDIY